MGIFTALFLLFTGLKLSGIIAWSWWWITAPLWGEVLLVFLVVGASVLMYSKKHRR